MNLRSRYRVQKMRSAPRVSGDEPEHLALHVHEDELLPAQAGMTLLFQLLRNPLQRCSPRKRG
ncbi:hypothetical protein DDK14_11545 [Mycobacteroides abscessus]|nr:hypothetical protein DDK14_11545 [Mycobacteroides abscessus]